MCKNPANNNLLLSNQIFISDFLASTPHVAVNVDCRSLFKGCATLPAITTKPRHKVIHQIEGPTELLFHFNYLLKLVIINCFLKILNVYMPIYI